jgi:putative alpha-1,2-mannosidase
MVQLSPDTGLEGWDWCSGYHYSDSSIIGFSHLHLSGTGGADLGDIMIMPFTGKNNGSPEPRRILIRAIALASRTMKKRPQQAITLCLLQDYQIEAELTVTPRTGIHRYRFLDDDVASVIIDLKHGISSQPRACYIEITGENEIRGLRASQGWAADQQVYFVAHFSHPIVSYEFMKDDEVAGSASERVEGRSVKAILDFGQLSDRELMVKVGISAVDEEGALKNLEAEATHWSFETYSG